MFAEAKIIVRATGRDALDFDPVNLRVTMLAPGTQVPMIADANDQKLIEVIASLIDDDNLLGDNEDSLTLVWSDCGFEVKITCPNCGDVFPASDAWFGPDAIHCGCDEEDM